MIAFFLFVLELQIFISAVMKSGDHSKIQVLNTQNEVIYESDENKLYQFDRYYFEKTFGPLDTYKKRRLDINRPFPFRGWIISAIGIPVGFMLVLGFIVKAWAVFFKGEKPTYDHSDGDFVHPPEKKEPVGRIENLIHTVSKMNIFVLGFFIVATLFLYWVLPDMIMYISRMGLETIIRFKWFFISVFLCFAALFAWFIYLRYLLARKSIESRTEIEKMKLQIIHNSSGNEFSQKSLAMNGDDDK